MKAKPVIPRKKNSRTGNAETKTWEVSDHHHTLCNQLADWQENGSKLIGGCCRATPKDIQDIATKLLKIYSH